MNEEMFIRHTEPDLYEIPPEDILSKGFRGYCAAVRDKLTHFTDATTEHDLKAVTAATDCPYKSYELHTMKELLHTYLLYYTHFPINRFYMNIFKF